MFNTFLSYLVLYGLQDNIFICGGAGALQVQREKMYRSFRYINALFLILGIIVTSLISYVLYNYVYELYDLFYIHISVNVFIVAVYHLIVSLIWQKISSYNYYLYDAAFSYGFDVVYTISILFTLDMSLSIVNFILSLLAISIVVILMNVFMGFYIRSMNRGYLNINFRNVSVRLFLLAIFAMVLQYAGMLVV